mgnify:CR=1 FL=1
MKEWIVHFRDMLDFAERARAIAHGNGDDDTRKLALERALELIGEAAKRIPRELQPQWQDIPWKDLIDLRNVISHEYEVLTLRKLESIAKEDIPTIIDAIQNILAQHGE